MIIFSAVPVLDWYRFSPALLTRIYYRRVTVVRLGAIPETGPMLCVGLHRNGAVDGMVYKTVVPNATFLISVQLLRDPIAHFYRCPEGCSAAA